MMTDSKYIGMAQELKDIHDAGEGILVLLPINEIDDYGLVHCELMIKISRDGYTDLSLEIRHNFQVRTEECAFIKKFVATRKNTENNGYTIDDIVVLIKELVSDIHNNYRQIRYDIPNIDRHIRGIENWEGGIRCVGEWVDYGDEEDDE